MNTHSATTLSEEQNRLLALLAFTKESVRLRTPTVADITQYAAFHAFEAQLADLPGVNLNLSQATSDDTDELWLRVERLQEQGPPNIADSQLQALTELSNNPSQQPVLRQYCPAQTLHRLALLPDEATQLPTYNPLAPVALGSLAVFAELTSALSQYIQQQWKPWAVEEIRRRRTIGWYSKLYALKQQLDGGLTEAQLELVWGMGVAAWQLDKTEVRYPLLTQLVELTLNPQTMALEVRPREVVSRLEVDVYAAHELQGVAGLEQGSRPLLAENPYSSPFEPSTFESILRLAVGLLDAQGRYLPDESTALARVVPAAGPHLVLTDTWVLFARPRSNNSFLQDLEALRDKVEQLGTELPAAVAALVREPATTHSERPIPAFRGLSLVGGPDIRGAQDLYFPLPFNEEQVRIVQLLEHAPGVVVQGPPGTGKTHTIANVICHYLALGKRVLVTSMKDPALAVLRDKLPASVRPLAISLLSSEREGLKQFEHAVQRIAHEVQRLDKPSATRHIDDLAKQLDATHAQLAHIDRRISQWGTQNLQPLVLDGERIEPRDAAQEVVAQEALTTWLPDALTIGEEHQPQFDEADIAALRSARRELAMDILYLYASLPSIAALPNAREMVLMHQQLSRSQELFKAVMTGELPALVAGPDELEQLSTIVAKATELQQQQQKVSALPWATKLRLQLGDPQMASLYEMLASLGSEIQLALVTRQQFLLRRVDIPSGLEQNAEIVAAIASLAQGQRPFGVAGWFGKSLQKQRLGEIRILLAAPANNEDWAYVNTYLRFLRQLRKLAVRWNTLAPEIGLPQLTAQESFVAVTEAYRLFQAYLLVRETMQAEITLNIELQQLFPAWAPASTAANQALTLQQAVDLVEQHQTRLQLEKAWAVRKRYEEALQSTTGDISVALRRFVQHSLGRPAVSDADLQDEWAVLLQEVQRVHKLKPLLSTVTTVTAQIAASGASQWAQQLRKAPASSVVDQLLPDDWRVRWRLQRLANHLELLDSRAELAQLSNDRREAEKLLARTYQEIITQKTWLQLAINATPQVRSALEAYRNAIAKIGKGTGKSAPRHRQHARQAASQASAAIPCWIMPHYRVSESLPAELGAFDLVIIDEASQSDLTALPAVLRARKILVVGDDKQVSPEGIGLQEEKIRHLMARFLTTQVSLYAPQLSPERSVYDLFKVVYADSGVMLKEHFRCVGPIIEYSKREFYNHEIRPLRLPKASERLDPPLVDVLVEDGVRRGDTNAAEAHFIVAEIQQLVADPAMAGRTVGVVSLLADKQAKLIWDLLEQEIGLEAMLRHEVACGDARTFQGKERDIMFLSMVVSKGNATALGRQEFAKRFNVAASRARERMYLVRSIEAEDLSAADHLRRGLLAHFVAPFAQDERRVSSLRELCESPFEEAMYDLLTERGYRVQPQVPVGNYRIDLVVEGENDQRLAVECDGDRYHGPDRWEADMQRQRILERAGWQFWRCFASTFVRWREDTVNDLLSTLNRLGIQPIGAVGANPSQHTETRLYVAFPLPPPENSSIQEAQHDVSFFKEPNRIPSSLGSQTTLF